MAKIKDIIAKEDTSVNIIKLYKEGIFYKAYEYSAYLFVQQIRSYQVKRKYSLQLKRDLVSIGFPVASFSSLELPENSSLLETEFGLELKLSEESLDLSAFELWKGRIAFSEKRAELAKGSVKPVQEKAFSITSLEYDVLERLKRFELNNSTPMACLLFLSELQKSLNLLSQSNELRTATSL